MEKVNFENQKNKNYVGNIAGANLIYAVSNLDALMLKFSVETDEYYFTSIFNSHIVLYRGFRLDTIVRAMEMADRDGFHVFKLNSPSEMRDLIDIMYTMYP